MKSFLAAALLLPAGCVGLRAEPPGPDHPANPTAAEARVALRADPLGATGDSSASASIPASKPAAEHLERINRLPAEDRPAALAQGVCPVSGEPLGSMGVPRKVTAEGRTFFLCCKGCEPKLAADPQAILRKLGPAAAGEEQR